MKKIAVLLAGSNHIVSITDGTNPIYAAKQADASRGINRARAFRETPQHAAHAEYHCYLLDAADAKFVSEDIDRFSDPKYFNYIRVNCPHKVTLAAA